MKDERLRIGTNNRPLPPFKRDSNYPRYVFVDRCILRILNVEVVLGCSSNIRGGEIINCRARVSSREAKRANQVNCA